MNTIPFLNYSAESFVIVLLVFVLVGLAVVVIYTDAKYFEMALLRFVE